MPNYSFFRKILYILDGNKQDARGTEGVNKPQTVTIQPITLKINYQGYVRISRKRTNTIRSFFFFFLLIYILCVYFVSHLQDPMENRSNKVVN